MFRFIAPYYHTDCLLLRLLWNFVILMIVVPEQNDEDDEGEDYDQEEGDDDSHHDDCGFFCCSLRPDAVSDNWLRRCGDSGEH